MNPLPTKLLVLLLIALTSAQAKRRFRDIAANPSRSGLFYSRVPSLINAQWKKTLELSLTEPLSASAIVDSPWGTYGHPGVAVGDFNGDGVDDIYVTNGPGAPNSLFINTFPKTGSLRFRDIADKAGVAAMSQDSTGVCYGDLNNDGHTDLVVLSEFNANKIFLSKGDGTFQEISWLSATGDKSSYPSASCAMGDVDHDGRLDLLIANAVPRATYRACLAVPFDLGPPNQLFINTGTPGTFDLTFDDVSLTSGINDFGGDIPPGKYTQTWVASLIDIDLDGNLDIVVADDQCGVPTKRQNPDIGVNRGDIHVQIGDGKGHFKSRKLSPVDPEKNNRRGGEGWMGLAFGDFNCDGKIDFFASNFGDYHGAAFDKLRGRATRNIGSQSSRWFLADNSAQGFADASINETGPTVFGWGSAVFDYDNDGDQDIVFVGSLDVPFFLGSDNPNVIYKNKGCKAKFSLDLASLKPTGSGRNYHGLAIGDFNMDGYPDVVDVSPVVSDRKNWELVAKYNSPLDKTAYFTTMLKSNPTNGTFTWTGRTVGNGDMMVQINRPSGRRRCWVSVRPLGMQGILKGGMVNRGALGSTIIVEPNGLRPVIAPIVSGDSLSSQHSPRRNFGLGKACRGTVDILWPRGVRNRLYAVRNKEMLTLPEIPCSFTGEWNNENTYQQCVEDAVGELVRKGVVTEALGDRMIRSARKARKDHIRNN